MAGLALPPRSRKVECRCWERWLGGLRGGHLPPSAAMRGRGRRWSPRQAPDLFPFFPFFLTFLPPSLRPSPGRDAGRRRPEAGRGREAAAQGAALRRPSRPGGCVRVEAPARATRGVLRRSLGSENWWGAANGQVWKDPQMLWKRESQMLALEAGANISLMKSGTTVPCSGRKNREDEAQSIRKLTVLKKDSKPQEFPLI